MLWWVPAGIWVLLTGAYGYEAVTSRPYLRRTGKVDRRHSTIFAGLYAVVAILWIVSQLAA